MVKLIQSAVLRKDDSFSSVLKINFWHVFNACSEFRTEEPFCSVAFSSLLGRCLVLETPKSNGSQQHAEKQKRLCLLDRYWHRWPICGGGKTISRF